MPYGPDDHFSWSKMLNLKDVNIKLFQSNFKKILNSNYPKQVTISYSYHRNDWERFKINA